MVPVLVELKIIVKKTKKSGSLDAKAFCLIVLLPAPISVNVSLFDREDEGTCLRIGIERRAQKMMGETLNIWKKPASFMNPSPM